jgi:urease accessory protein
MLPAQNNNDGRGSGSGIAAAASASASASAPSFPDVLASLPALPPHDVAVPPGAAGLLDVAVAACGTRCDAVRVRAVYPLKLMVPAHLASFALPGGPSRAAAADVARVPRPVWCYIVSYGGGLVAGDAVAVSVRVGAGATAVLATQASTKVYHARGRATSDSTPAERAVRRSAAVSSVSASVGAGGLLAILPDPVIAFADARFRQRQRIVLAHGASLVLMDWCSSGRRARGEAWEFASYETRTEVMLAAAPVADADADAGAGACADAPHAPHVPLLVDALRLEGAPASPLRSRMGRAHVVGVLILVGPRVAEHAAALLRDLSAFTALCFSRSRARPGGADGTQPPPPFFFAAGSALEGAGGGAVIRIAAEEADAAYAWARAALAPLHAQLGGAPYRT